MPIKATKGQTPEGEIKMIRNDIITIKENVIKIHRLLRNTKISVKVRGFDIREFQNLLMSDITVVIEGEYDTKMITYYYQGDKLCFVKCNDTFHYSMIKKMENLIELTK